MKKLADGVWHVKCLPGLPWSVNAYLAGDVLIDAGCRQSTGRILLQLDGHEVRAHALTHAHPDHQGASHDVCEKLGIPFWCPDGHKVDKALEKDDEVAGFDVLDAPGHSAGHVAFWRDADRVLIIGDVLTNLDQYSGIPGLHEPSRTSRPTPAGTGSRREGWRDSSRSWSASVTARRCATRTSSRISSTVSLTSSRSRRRR